MKLAKRVILVLVCCLVSFWAVAQFEYIEYQEEKVEKVSKDKWLKCGKKGRNPVRISTFTTNPPFAWSERKKEKDGTYVYFTKGYNIDFIRKITNELKISTQFVAYKTDEEVVRAFVRGDLDIIVGMYYDAANYSKIASPVVPSYMQNFITVVFMKGKEKDIKSFDDLSGLKGVVRTDERFYDYVYKMIPADADIIQVSNSRDAFTKLLTGEVDYMLASPYSAEAEARRFKLNLDISMLPMPLLGQELFVMYSQASPCKQYGRMIARKIRERREDINGMKRDLISYIDNWGQRFKDAPPLWKELGLPKPTVEKVKRPVDVPATSEAEQLPAPTDEQQTTETP